MGRKLQSIILCIVSCWLLGAFGAPRAWADSAKFLDYTLHDDEPKINCDAVHLKIPQGWAASGHVQWNLTVMMPGKWYVCAANPKGPELWIRYPGQAFIWRDNFNLLGLDFQLHMGDADPAMGDEIEQPLQTATDCIRQVILPRFRKDIAQASVVSSTEMTPDNAMTFAKAVVPDLVNSPQAQQLQITPKGATMRLRYTLNGQTVQEGFRLLAVYIDLPSNNGIVHVWTIPYCMSFRAADAQLTDQYNAVGKTIDDSLKVDPQWTAKRDAIVSQAAQTYGNQLRQLATAVESNIIANMNRNIFNMCQQSFHRRMQIEQQTFHGIDNVLVGMSDYAMPDGSTVRAPMVPLGQTAWRNQSGGVVFFDNGVDPNGSLPGQYQRMTQK